MLPLSNQPRWFLYLQRVAHVQEAASQSAEREEGGRQPIHVISKALVLAAHGDEIKQLQRGVQGVVGGIHAGQ